jgi:predicted nucleotide-binding protein (sugar kinase/HSP70/actin superfamily)
VEINLKTLYNIQIIFFLEMDPGMSEVNALNRLNFIVVSARERMKTEGPIARI